MTECFLREFWFDCYDYCYEWYRGLTRNPSWLLMRKIGRFDRLRSLIYSRSNNSVRPEIPSSVSSSCCLKTDVKTVVDAIEQKGLFLGLDLSPQTTKEILKFARTQPCYGHRKAEFGFYFFEREEAEQYYKKSFAVASYFNTATNCAAIANLISDPTLLAIAAQYLKATPVHISTQLWWSFVTESTLQERRKAAQVFHYDLDDYRFIKFFFYLTEVDLLSGAHICVEGTHKRKKFSHQLVKRRFSDLEILDYYGSEHTVTISGQPGSGFVEDPLCFHKGMPPIRRDRLMLQIEYALHDYGMQRDEKLPHTLKAFSTSRFSLAKPAFYLDSVIHKGQPFV